MTSPTCNVYFFLYFRYQIMLDCWKEQPQHRPTFTDLRQQFDTMITKQEDTSQIYIELDTDNSQYIS